MTCQFQRFANYLTHAIILTAGLALIQPAASAQIVATNVQPTSGNADSLIGENLEIDYSDGIGGALLPETEIPTWDEIAQGINDSLKLEFSDRLSLSVGNFDLESYPQPEQIIFVRPGS